MPLARVVLAPQVRQLERLETVHLVQMSWVQLGQTLV
jgi:hypothetical protein